MSLAPPVPPEGQPGSGPEPWPGGEGAVPAMPEPSGEQPPPVDREVIKDAELLAAVVAETTDPEAVAEYAEVRQALAAAHPAQPFGRPGPPLALRSPLRVTFLGAIGLGLAFALAAAVFLARGMLLLILLAAFLAVGLDPLVRWLVDHRVRRGLAVAAVMIGILFVVIGCLASAVPVVVHESNELVHGAPDYFQRAATRDDTVGRLVRNLHLADRARNLLSNPSTLTGGALGTGRAVIGVLFATITVLVLTAYFLSSLPTITATAYRLIPQSRRARVGLIGDEILRRIGRYLLGNLVTSLLAGLGTMLFCLATGVPYAVFLGLLVALFDLIPMVGAWIAGVVVTLVALTVSVTVAIAAALFMLAFRMVEDYLVAPRVMTHAVDVPPVATVVAVLIGGALLGVPGALMAIPVAAACKLVLSEVVFPRQDES